MIVDAIKKFAQENFSHKYFPVLLGESDKIQPLALVVKQHRPIWKRPFGRSEIVILAGFEKYVEDGVEQTVQESITSKIQDEELPVKQKIDLGARNDEAEMGSGFAGWNIKMNDDKGLLELGILSQKYINDPDLRGILANTGMDATKMKPFAECDKLLLITSVIYSEKFELKGERKQQAEEALEVGNLPEYLQFLNLNRTSAISFHRKHTYIPPDAAARNSQAPFLFKCCRVEFNKETSRLEVCKGEYVGKVVTHRDVDVTGREEDDENDEYDGVLVEATDQTDSPDCLTAKDIEILDKITKVVLLPEKTIAQRKARVSKYLHWFVKALMTADRNLLTLDEPLTLEDCAFLRNIYVAAEEDETELDLTSLSTEEIQDFAIVFKLLDELTDAQWRGMETVATCPDKGNLD